MKIPFDRVRTVPLGFLVLANLVAAQEQQIVFCAETVVLGRYGSGYYEECEASCKSMSQCDLRTASSEGWQITAAMPQEVSAIEFRCSCKGTKYVLTKVKTPALIKPVETENEVRLLKKELELLQQEMALQRRLAEEKESKALPKQVAPAPGKSNLSKDPDNALWAEVKLRGTKEYYEAYLRAFPRGRFAVLAKVELKKIEEQTKAELRQANLERDNRDQQRREYLKVLHTKIRGNLALPFVPKDNPEFVFDVTQNSTGKVVAVSLRQSSGNVALDAAVERAILKSSPLPIPQSTELFSRVLELRFRPIEEQDVALHQRLVEESAYWQQAFNSNSRKAIEGYLDRYPNGRFVPEAKSVLQTIIDQANENREPVSNNDRL